MEKIILEGDNNEFLNIRLRDILLNIKDPLLKWKIFWIYGVGEPDFPMLETEKLINSSKQGLLITISELLKLDAKIQQLYEILLVADYDEKNLVKYASDEEMYKCCNLVIQLIDSTYWEITTNSLLNSEIRNALVKMGNVTD